MPTYHGRNTQLLLQRMVDSRTVPAAAAFKMKYSTLEIGDDEDYPVDPTLDNSSPLQVKRDEGDESPSASVESIFCLNDIGQWLTLLWGAPVTTGTGPYTHTFTLDLSDRPFALLELGYTDATALYRRWLDVFLNSLSWDVMAKEQNLSLGLIPCVQVSPDPAAVFDAAPTAYAKNRACSAGGEIYDIQGASTLGKVTGGKVEITNDLEAHHLADGLKGYGLATLGEPSIKGSLSGILTDDSNVMQYAEGHTSFALSLVSKNAAGDHSLTLNLANVETGKFKHAVPTSKGLAFSTDWMAHAGGAAPTLVLVNGVASY